MDSEFIVLSLVFILLGVTGIVLFSGPLTPSGDSCYCPIPSPEPGAAQGTSSILLLMGLMFFPMGLMKGGLPSFRRAPTPTPATQIPGGRVISPIQIESGSFFALGLVILLVGVDLILVPGYLVYKNFWYELAGTLLTAAGTIAMLWGLRKPNAH
ncbi:MAG: hypothetical protein OK404_03295 [Thaumarchaeota archaeon]|nr:hypothetical protein [Nitrososphaerota archaeon]